MYILSTLSNDLATKRAFVETRVLQTRASALQRVAHPPRRRRCLTSRRRKLKQRVICCLGWSRARSTQEVLLPVQKALREVEALRPVGAVPRVVEVPWMAAVLDCVIEAP
jgi:hypothetical protein